MKSFSVHNTDYVGLNWTPNKPQLLWLTSSKSDPSRGLYKHQKRKALKETVTDTQTSRAEYENKSMVTRVPQKEVNIDLISYDRLKIKTSYI